MFDNQEVSMSLNTKCKFHGNEHPESLCFRHSILKDGPTRVIVNEEGNAVPSEQAKNEFGLVPTVIFLRNDGWSLGVPRYLESVAKKLWRGSWIAVARSPFGDFKLINT